MTISQFHSVIPRFRERYYLRMVSKMRCMHLNRLIIRGTPIPAVRTIFWTDMIRLFLLISRCLKIPSILSMKQTLKWTVLRTTSRQSTLIKTDKLI
ncbi:hypothetical protein ES703_77742 [subsurface metagenome]